MSDIKKIKVGNTTYDIRDATAARSNHTHTPSEAGAAAAHHLYHTWDNNTNYYDSYEGGNMFRIVTENMYADCFRFQASTVSNLEYYNGSSWASWNFDLSNLFDGNARTGVSIPYANRKFRFQLTANGGWPTTALFMLQGTWFDDGGWPNGQKSSIIIETRASTSDAWSQKASFDLSGVEGMAGRTLSSLHTGNALYRITIEIAPWTKTSNRCPLQRLCLFSNYNGGALETLSYTGTGNITTSKSISAGSFIENGKSLANKYLGKTAKAADADKLDGNDSTYYLNLDNINDGSTRKLSNYVPKSLTSAKGDMIYASGANTPARLAIGSNGQFLSIADGIPKWVNNPNTDTKNTTGSTDSTEKLYLVGAKSQAANPQTYSSSKVYMTDGALTTSSIMTGDIKSSNSSLILGATSSDGSARNVASFEADSGEGTRAVLHGHLAVFGDNDDSSPYKPTDKTGFGDLDTSYFNTGIALYDNDTTTTYKLSFPAKSGTFATLDDTKIEIVDLTTIA